jgi:hypothetical protein
MEKRYRKMKKEIITILFCGLLYCESNQVVICQNTNDYVGRYYSLSQDFPSDTMILDLQTNGRFCYFPFKVSYLGWSGCDSIKGDWTTKRNSIILNSDFQEKDYIKILSKYEQKDSVKIRLVKYPNGILWSKIDIFIANNKGEKHFLAETDENGIVVIPKGYKVMLFPFNLNPPKIPKLKGGAYYQFTSVDCIPEIFENKKLEIQGDILIMYEKYSMKDKNKKYKKMYFKSNPK